MTQEEKQLLLTDICIRLPYVTYYDLSYYGHKTRAVLQEFIATKEPLKSLVKVNTIVKPIPYENIKPYLRPMSSMTADEKDELYDWGWDVNGDDIYSGGSTDADNVYQTYQKNLRDAWWLINWLNAHHFDYRGLIEKGLALDAPEGMYEV